ncbi:hypothetical protein [Shewanella marina]|uniref:hypothetical protein n=1 Tax=Shewanella marina TaxID=487319 RepID=UPI000471E42B|nr:hypothetical protein [Shewanella marina]
MKSTMQKLSPTGELLVNGIAIHAEHIAKQDNLNVNQVLNELTKASVVILEGGCVDNAVRDSLLAACGYLRSRVIRDEKVSENTD